LIFSIYTTELAMLIRRYATTVIASLSILLIAGAAGAAIPVELEVATDAGAPPGTMQEWGRVLAEMDLARLRLRGRGRADEPSLKITGEGASRRYLVLGIINRRGELLLPDGRFTQGDAAQLKKHFADLPEVVEEAAIERGRFGLTKPGFEALFQDFSAPAPSSTKGKPLAEVIAVASRGLKTPLEIDAAARAAINAAPPLDAELEGMSRGTALALAFRLAGLAMVPAEPRGQPVTLRVVPEGKNVQGWPAGWQPAKVGRVVAPAMYRFTVIEIEGYTLARALAALEPHMTVPLVFDQRVLTARKIDPATVNVKLPKGKIYIRRAVERILSQGRLSGELRVDEADRLFYWITQFGDDSPRAMK
jgi:hypothetical protein